MATFAHSLFSGLDHGVGDHRCPYTRAKRFIAATASVPHELFHLSLYSSTKLDSGHTVLYLLEQGHSSIY